MKARREGDKRGLNVEEGMATHSSILSWRIPWTEEPGQLQFMGSKRLERNWSDSVHTHTQTISGSVYWCHCGKQYGGSQKINRTIEYSHSTSDYFSEENRNTNLKYMLPYTHCSIIFNSQDICGGILLSHKKEWDLAI